MIQLSRYGDTKGFPVDQKKIYSRSVNGIFINLDFFLK